MQIYRGGFVYDDNSLVHIVYISRKKAIVSQYCRP